jgi:hypothetical protein
MHLRTLALATTTAVLLTGCGGGDDEKAAAPSASPTPTEDSRSGEELVADAVAALRDAGAVHATGTVTQDGKEAGLDVQLQDSSASGSLTMDGQTIEFLVIEGDAYLQAPAEFWVASGSPESLAKMIADKWLLMPAEQAGDLGPLSLDGLTDELVDPESGVSEDVKTGRVDGEDVLIATTEDGSTMSVLADGSDYPVLVEKIGQEDPGSVAFSGFGKHQEITAPADFIDRGDIGG